MPIITCPECGNKISDKALSCPNCGCPIEHDGRKCEQSGAEPLIDEDAIQMAEVPDNQSDAEANQQDGCPSKPIRNAGESKDNPAEYDIAGGTSMPKHGLAGKRHGGGRKRLGKGAPALIAVGLFEFVIGVLLATTIICIHQWSGNNCEEANHCVNCGMVDPDGKIDPDAHSWNEADCTKPRTCARCGLTDGKKNPNNHALEDHDGGGKICWKCGKVFAAQEETYDGTDKNYSVEDDAGYESAGYNGSSDSDYDYLYDEESGISGVMNDEGEGVFSGDDFAMRRNEDGSSVATDGKGNWIADSDGDGEIDSISIDGGETWL